MTLNPTLATLFAPAYAPCIEFQSACKDMRWQPDVGHDPRGFAGAAGSLDEVELVLVVAEPGDPQHEEQHEGLQTTYAYTTACFASGKDLFHRNARKILRMCWPELPFERQMQKVWITESILCSATVECGGVPAAAAR